MDLQDPKGKALVSPAPELIRSLSYVRLLAFISESNMPPGGLATISRIVQYAHIRPGIKVLHAGCNTGFLTREVARLSGCSLTGIDIEPSMVQAAKARAKLESMAEQVTFHVADMCAMPFPTASIDVVLSGGALAFVQGHADAVREWVRVVRPGGRLADAEFYYRDAPPASIRRDLSDVLGVEVPEYDRGYWESLFRQGALVPYWVDHAAAQPRSDDDVSEYCRRMAVFAATAEWSSESKAVLERRLLEIFRLFNENMKYLSYTMFVYRRMADHDEPALYG